MRKRKGVRIVLEIRTQYLYAAWFFFFFRIVPVIRPEVFTPTSRQLTEQRTGQTGDRQISFKGQKKTSVLLRHVPIVSDVPSFPPPNCGSLNIWPFDQRPKATEPQLSLQTTLTSIELKMLLNFLLVKMLTHPSAYLSIYLFIYPLIQPLSYPSIHPLIYIPARTYVHPLIHSPAYLSIHPGWGSDALDRIAVHHSPLRTHTHTHTKAIKGFLKAI